MALKVDGIATKSGRFELENAGLFILAAEAGVLVRLIEIDGWLHVMLEVREDTTNEAIRKATPAALELRDRLLEHQGPWMGGGDNPFLEQLSSRQGSRESYRRLSERINKAVADRLYEYAEYVREFEAARPRFKTMFDFCTWQPTANRFALDHARDLLEALKLKSTEIDECLREGLQRIEAGEPPFEDEYPVSRDKVRETLRSWRQGRRHRIYRAKEMRNCPD